MWAVSGIVLLTIGYVWLELPAMRRNKQYKEIAVFSLLVAASLAAGIPLALHVKLPNPLDWIEAALKPVSEAIYGAAD
ncbi:MAG: hypothetical protein J7639_19575 [Paenibacillaceae bacterium]|nr:hypothetical protein [Paenibacillaceae bacterium]